MQLYIKFFELQLPLYGVMIALGVVLANVVAAFVLKHTKQDFNDFIILESYCMLGGFVGAKILYLLVSFNDIQWKKITNFEYFNEFMLTGFVFYGGFIGGMLFVYIASKIHKIKYNEYLRNFIFLIPFIHSFGRIGCFMAGCCYGRPYDGVFAVVYPENSFALSGVKLFPVQIVEASLLLIISIIILVLQIKKDWYYTIETYMISYGVVRFILEYFRYDEFRGRWLWMSTSQWISVGLIVIAIFLIINNKNKK